MGAIGHATSSRQIALLADDVPALDDVFNPNWPRRQAEGLCSPTQTTPACSSLEAAVTHVVADTLVSLLSYLKKSSQSWTLVWSPRPEGRIAVLSKVWSHHAQR